MLSNETNEYYIRIYNNNKNKKNIMKTRIFNNNTVARKNTVYVLLTRMYNDQEQIIDCDTFAALKAKHLDDDNSRVYKNIMSNFDYYIVPVSSYTKTAERQAELDMFFYQTAQ